MVHKTRVQIVRENQLTYNGVQLDSTEVAINTLLELCSDLLSSPQEELWVITLDNNLRVINVHPVHRGTVNTVTAHPRDIFQRVLLDNATNFFLVHNHPSGTITPSDCDIQLTRRIKELGNLIGVPLLDHFILTTVGNSPVGRSIRDYMKGDWHV